MDKKEATMKALLAGVIFFSLANLQAADAKRELWVEEGLTKVTIHFVAPTNEPGYNLAEWIRDIVEVAGKVPSTLYIGSPKVTPDPDKNETLLDFNQKRVSKASTDKLLGALRQVLGNNYKEITPHKKK